MWVWERGHDREWVLDLTMEQFADLFEVCQSLDDREKVHRAWSNMLSAQGKSKDLKKFLEPHTKRKKGQ